MISCGISDGRGLEEGTHLGGTALQAAPVGGQTGLERRLVLWRATARHRLLEIVVEAFVWIVLGGIGRQVEEFDLISMVLHPGDDPELCSMRHQPETGRRSPADPYSDPLSLREAAV